MVEVVSKMGIWLKCDMRFGEGVGDKLILRALAGELGLVGARGLKKRAIHFGARTAVSFLALSLADGNKVR